MTVIWFAYGFGPTMGRRAECWADLQRLRTRCVWSMGS